MSEHKNLILAIIPARGGSKTIPRKNVRPLNEKPLIYYTIIEAIKSKYLNRIIVSTEDKEIAEIVTGYGAEVIERPEELAYDDIPSLPVVQQAIRYLEDTQNFYPDIIVTLQPTSPLRTVQDIDNAIKKFLEAGCASLVSVCEVEHTPYWMYTIEEDRLKQIIENEQRINRRQDAPKIYRLNGAIYIARRNIIIEQNTIMGSETKAFIMPLERSIDIDTELDFKLAELLMRESKSR